MLGLIDQLKIASKRPSYQPSFVCTDGRVQHLKDNHKLQTDRAIAKYRNGGLSVSCCFSRTALMLALLIRLILLVWRS